MWLVPLKQRFRNFLGRSSFLGRALRDQRGMAAVEFAMLLPVMVLAYLGTTEISQAVGIDRKVTLIARTVADLVAQSTSVTNTEMNNILNASAAVGAPYPASNLKIVVSCLTLDAQGVATVTWSDTRNGSARAVGQVVAVPSALAVANTTLIWSEVQYTYQPTIGYVITGALTLKDQLYMRPRKTTTVTRGAS